MRKLSIVLFTLLMLVSCAATRDQMLDSIRPLQIVNEAGELQNICTVWSIRIDSQPYDVTAAHCLVSEDLYVDGRKVVVVKVDPTLDLAILRGAKPARPFPVAFISPKSGDPIWSAGYAQGMKYKHVVWGFFGMPNDDDKAFYSVPTIGGMSGSPYLTKDNFVVGVLQQSECRPAFGWCAVSRGVRTDELRSFLFGE